MEAAESADRREHLPSPGGGDGATAWSVAERDSHHGFVDGLAVHPCCNSCLSTYHEDKHCARPWDTLGNQLDADPAFLVGAGRVYPQVWPCLDHLSKWALPPLTLSLHQRLVLGTEAEGGERELGGEGEAETILLKLKLGICMPSSLSPLLAEASHKAKNGEIDSTSKWEGFPGGSGASKESACDAGDLGLIPGLGRSPGGGHGNPLQYSCLENPHGQRSLVGHNEDCTSRWEEL